MSKINNDCRLVPIAWSYKKRYKKAMIRKRRNQKEILTPKTEVGKTKLALGYLYLENIS